MLSQMVHMTEKVNMRFSHRKSFSRQRERGLNMSLGKGNIEGTILRALYREPAGPATLRQETSDPSVHETLRGLWAEGFVTEIGKDGALVYQLTRKGQSVVEGWAARSIVSA